MKASKAFTSFKDWILGKYWALAQNHDTRKKLSKICENGSFQHAGELEESMPTGLQDDT
ncbi:hypothetical protein [Flavilitoribacter nigricans]|uniref:hypothetical protein n=1 Tax=Flavilitoribacter nigricans TaxID=70997 RepID=UPI0014755D76|nr:hypothetical protein [Flavilitoribacter nigricans]